MADSAIVFTHDLLNTSFAKTCHGLLRGTNRYEVLAVINADHTGRDAGEILDGTPRGIPIFDSVKSFLQQSTRKPKYCVVGVAFPGGRLPEACRRELFTAMKNGLSIVCGLHEFLSEDPEFRRLAQENNVELIDIRKPRPTADLHFWSGEIYSIRPPVIAVLGTDCAVGKRTTARFLMETCHANGIKAELIYTGQTGWMQGYKHGFIFDATPNDFVSGEIERVILECARESKPDIIFIEGQSSLRNPSGPCGSEFLLSGNAKGIILQHAPSREFFIDLEDSGCQIPQVKDEIDLIRYFGVETLAVTLSEEGWDDQKMELYKMDLSEEIKIPVIRPLVDGVESLIPLLRNLIATSGDIPG